MSREWGGGRGGALGAARVAVHHRVRGHRGVAGLPTLRYQSWRSCCGWRGAACPTSSPASSRPVPGSSTGSPGCAGSGSTRSPHHLGQRHLLVVTCHDTGRLVWAGKDRNQHTLGRFFDDLGAERAGQLTHVSADGAECEPRQGSAAPTPDDLGHGRSVSRGGNQVGTGPFVTAGRGVRRPRAASQAG